MAEIAPLVPPAILVVDDDVWNARLVLAVLEKAGYRATHLSSPVEALPHLRKERISLVLLDQNMPEMDGLTLLAEIRKESEVPVVMLTAQDRSDLAVRALRLGAYDYLTKPLDEQRLLEILPQAIGSDLSTIRQIAHYEIDGELGRGGMGVVYSARDTRLGRHVALKVLLPELAADASYEREFLLEARHAARFSHPNIVTVYEAGRYRGRLYIAMELIRGQTLQSVNQTGLGLSLRKIFDIGLQVSAAMEAVHAAGMLHHDLKPGNLMVSADSTIKVLDFGLVRPLLQGDQKPSETTRSFAGTLSYIPPEVLTKGKTDVRGDVYSLGVVLYELLSGMPAFKGDTEFDLMWKIVEGKISRPWNDFPGTPPEVLSVVQRMMAPRPEERPASMSAVRMALEGVAANLPPGPRGS